jgi:spore germination protein YaaH
VGGLKHRRGLATRRLFTGVALTLAIAALGTASATAAAELGAPAALVKPIAPIAAAKRPALLQAFVLAGAPDSLADLEAHASEVGVVYPTFFACEPTGGRIATEGTAAETDAIAAYANAQRIAVLPRFNCQDGPTVHRILTEPRTRARTLAGLVQIAQTPAYAGVNLDLENDGAADRGALTSFVTALARELHAGGKQLTVDIDGVTHEDSARSTGLYDDRALAAAADHVFVIAWGAHWEGSAPGPIAPLAYVAAVARFLASLPHAGRFVLGAPMYGLDWPVAAGASGAPSSPSERASAGGSTPAGGPTSSSRQPPATALQYANVQALLGSTDAKPVLDTSVDELTFVYVRAGVAHRVWYLNARAIADRLRIARAHGLGIGVWRLGGEDQGLWSSATLAEGALG